MKTGNARVKTANKIRSSQLGLPLGTGKQFTEELTVAIETGNGSREETQIWEE
jgi:hypothetical protein